MPPAIRLQSLDFRYDPESPLLFKSFSFEMERAARTLLIGANGVGKSTLLRLIAGHHLVDPRAVEVLGRSPFHDPGLSGEIALVDGDFPIHLDLKVTELLDHVPPGASAPRERTKREKELIELLGVDPCWRMHRVSEGQRRRVQLLLALRRSFSLLLLDEVTAYLDVVVRADLLGWLKRSSERDGLSILYTSHILDGLWQGLGEPWPTHLAFLSFTGSLLNVPIGEVPALLAARELSGSASPLLTLCEALIREDLRAGASRSEPTLPEHP